MKREPAKRFEHIIEWQKTHQFVPSVYGLRREFPKEEEYGLATQLRRAAISIPANIAGDSRREEQLTKHVS
jgi:four helix bundle protein